MPDDGFSDDGWDRKYRPVISHQTAATKVSKLRPEDHNIPEEVIGAERASMPLACIAPLAIIHSLLTAPYMSPAAAYTLLSAITATWNWDASLAQLIRWIRASLYPTCTVVTSLPPLDMSDHITVGQQALHQKLVLRINVGHTSPNLYCAPCTTSRTSRSIKEENPCRVL